MSAQDSVSVGAVTTATFGAFRITTSSGAQYLLVNEAERPVLLTRTPSTREGAEVLPRDNVPVPVVDFDTVRVGEEATFRIQAEKRRAAPITRITTAVTELVQLL
ncbi:hypothetical protein [Mycetocola zhadangensis]|nr:hypothetical protein [Mycetocola zhadangensis]